MPRITPISWKVFECILIRCGFHYSRQSGSHRVYTKEGLSRPVIVPAHSKDLAAGIIQGN
ncbi:MAG: type II toxin-antitoxin system HicA family toxin, partial [Desulfobulbaceae bacterium]|nr:type II toxin-antitoxin system HicA family toxin [Desulfobulbaceae bacterium]